MAEKTGLPVAQTTQAVAPYAEESNSSCFFISPIGEPESDERKNSDQVLKHIIDPVAALFHLRAVRADQISEPGLITSQVLKEILAAKVVIADLTGGNPNVYYELAIRHAARLPSVQIICSPNNPPFDLAQVRVIKYDLTSLDSVAQCKSDMTSQIKSSLDNPEQMENPLTIVIDLYSRAGSPTDPVRSALFEIREALSNLSTAVREQSLGYRDGLNQMLAETQFMLSRSMGIPSASLERLIDESVNLSDTINNHIEFLRAHNLEGSSIERLAIAHSTFMNSVLELLASTPLSPDLRRRTESLYRHGLHRDPKHGIRAAEAPLKRLEDLASERRKQLERSLRKPTSPDSKP